MTERKRSAVSAEPRRARDRPLAGGLDAATGSTLEIDERAAPIPRRVRGRIEVRAEALNPRAFVLDEAGGHWWRPIMPSARGRGRHGRAGASLARAAAISTRTPAPSRSSAASPAGPGRAPRPSGARRSSTTPNGAAARRCRSPCSFDARGGFETAASAARATLPRTALGARPRDPRRRRPRQRAPVVRGHAVLRPRPRRAHAVRRARRVGSREPVARPLRQSRRAPDAAVPHAAAVRAHATPRRQRRRQAASATETSSISRLSIGGPFPIGLDVVKGSSAVA